MNQATPSLRDLAQRLLAFEANQSEHAEETAADALIVFEKLRSHLSRLVGVTGFQALLARALALAKSEANWLEAVRVQADATLEGFHQAAQQQPVPTVAAGSAALLAQLFSLLVTFIGEALTLRLVADVWPEAQGNSTHFSAEETRHE